MELCPWRAGLRGAEGIVRILFWRYLMTNLIISLTIAAGLAGPISTPAEGYDVVRLKEGGESINL